MDWRIIDSFIEEVIFKLGLKNLVRGFMIGKILFMFIFLFGKIWLEVKFVYFVNLYILEILSVECGVLCWWEKVWKRNI